MTDRPNKLFLMVALIFGVVVTAAGTRWLAVGEIAIREGDSSSRSVAAQPVSQKVAGRIVSTDLLYYPTCAAWIGLGASLVVLSTTAFFTARVLYAKLTAYALASVLPLGFGTVAAAIWWGTS